MKFTKKAFRAALKANDQTKVWYLTAIKFGRTPTRKEVHDLIEEVADTISDIRKAYDFSYNSERKRILEIKMRKAEYDNQRISHHIPKYWRGNVDYRMDALEILRRLLTEKPSNYTNDAAARTIIPEDNTEYVIMAYYPGADDFEVLGVGTKAFGLEIAVKMDRDVNLMFM